MQKFIIIFLVVFGVIFLYSKKEKQNTCDLKGQNILVLGDSIANNYGLDVSENFGYKIASALNKKAIIKGVNGLTSAGLLARLNDDFSGISDISAVLISIGGNDILRQISSTQSKQNIEKIANFAKSKSSCVVFLGVPDSALGALSGYGASFYDGIKDLKNVLLEDESMPKILKDRSLLLDRIHPNKQGHELIAKNILSLIR